MPEQLTSTSLVEQVFTPELTAQGLQDICDQYPRDVVYDMSDDKQFKQGKAARAERNKLTKAIDDKRKKVAASLKTHGDKLCADVTSAYDPIVEPMEKEEKRRKEAAAKLKREQEELLARERKQLNEIRDFVPNCQRKDAEYIAGVIESVDLIDTKVFSKELIHEAIQVKEQTLSTLMLMLNDAKAREKLQREQAEITVKQNLAQLQMYPSQCIGKSSAEIERRLDALRELPILESDYGDFITAAVDAKAMSMQQLEMMQEQARQLEALQPKAPPAPAEPKQQNTNSGCYVPLELWPSDYDRAKSDTLDFVCFKLEEAEQYIKILEAQFNAS
ncbi:hypothetical protein [Pseudoalteromonas piscicida]|uniref:hypothetical protein n=1 Tax=Pseudoalteromonas piscicida TaxID=43662 RepID=UPI0005FA6AFA|nr:hypothetical protein [Pseudoalteromonas piscicida]KJZ03258.1 hypothetical protein TW73_08895 [Pseudoalteromonas piscicida]